jgi:hypothetical protein
MTLNVFIFNSMPVNRLVFSFISALIILSYSCKDDEVVTIDQSHDYSYFPLEQGFWVEYNADSIVHLTDDDANDVDTSITRYHFQIREEIDSSFMDGENQKAYCIKRYRRDSDTLPWEFMNVWTAKITPYSAQRVEDNIRYIRLHFPITADATWKGNAYNFYSSDEDYVYENLYEPGQYNNLTFDSTISVLQYDFLSHINRIYKKEIYGPRVGMLFKQIDSVSTTNTSNGTIILSGIEYQLNIVGYKH